MNQGFLVNVCLHAVLIYCLYGILIEYTPDMIYDMIWYDNNLTRDFLLTRSTDINKSLSSHGMNIIEEYPNQAMF